jgi:O-acetyl-ADP-ribose deacetylase (regulator of RNase III)
MVHMVTQAARHALDCGTHVLLLRGDLTQARVDAIVNAANAHLSHGGGVAGAIVRQGGREIQQESDAWVLRHGPISHDHPAITGAGRLPCRKIIHALGPIWGEGDEDARLHAAFTGALRLADEQGLASLAFPAISTGIYGFPLPRAAHVSLQAVASYFHNHPGTSIREVQLILFDQTAYDVFLQAFRQLWPATTDTS